MSNQKQKLDTCGCCEGIKALTPVQVKNLPGLPALVYRVGTHSSFKKSMQNALSKQPSLRKLTTRDDDDPANALLDAWAMVLDVLTFYQERIANEGYLRPATERHSILEMARSIGYELRPGVAAGTYLAFTLENATGSPVSAKISSGTKAQSIPGQDELPQVFETIEDIVAKVKWNALKPKKTKLVLPASGDTTVYLKGTSTELKEGDVLLFVGKERENDTQSEKWALRKVKTVATVPSSEPGVDPGAGYTKVTLDTALDSETPSQDPKIYALRQPAALFGYNAPDWRAMSNEFKAGYLGLDPADQTLAQYSEWPGFNLASISDPPPGTAAGSGLYGEYYDTIDFKNLKAARVDQQINFDWGSGYPAPGVSIDTFSVRWTGWVQPRFSGPHTFYTVSDDGVRLWVNGLLIIDRWINQSSTEWTSVFTLDLIAGKKYNIKLEYYENGGKALIKLYWSAPGLTKEIIPMSQLYPRDVFTVHLDAIYKKIMPGSWIVLSIPDSKEIYSVETVAEDSRAKFALSAKTTRLKLKGKQLRTLFNEKLRETVIYAQSEKIEIGERPDNEPISGKEIVLDSVVSDLEKEHKLIITGKRVRAKVVNTVLFLLIGKPIKIIQLKPGDELIVMSPLATVKIFLLNFKMLHLKGNLEINGKNLECEGYAIYLGDMITFTSAGKDDETISELVELSSLAAEDDSHTKLVLEKSLLNVYDRVTVKISANVASATHGETKSEVLGSGDGSKKFQSFELKQKPLTFVSSATASGTETTLEIRVNDILWQETLTFYGVSPEAKVYITRIANDGKVTVQFGDGITGARLPTGTENVKVTYRIGTGLDGLVDAGQISQLMTRPLGVKAVINPLAPTGAADPEKLNKARQNAPLTVLTLDRIVSLQDFEDFARAFAGIGKAQAVALWDGQKQVVHLTIASAIGKKVDSKSALFINLTKAIKNSSDPTQKVQIDSYELLYFNLEAKVLIDPSYLEKVVEKDVRKALTDTFSFEIRSFGQAVTAAEVVSVIQKVSGVVAVDLDKLYLSSPDESVTQGEPYSRVPAEVARWDEDNTRILPAQLLLINPAGVSLAVKEATK